MIRFNKIQINSVYFTSDDLVSGEEYIGTVSGLTRLRPERRMIVRKAITGTPRAQVRSRLGEEIDITFNLVPDAKYDEIIASINSAEGSGNDHTVVITGPKGTFDLTCVRVLIDDGGEMQDAGHRDLSLIFWVKAVNSIS